MRPGRLYYGGPRPGPFSVPLKIALGSISAENLQARYCMRLLILVGVGFLGSGLWAQTSPSPYDAETIVRRSVEANAINYKSLPQLDYFKVERGEDGRTRTFEELMLFGSRYSRLLAIDGQPLSPERQRDERTKLSKAIQARMNESPAERKKRVATYKSERERDQLMLNEMANAFDFKLAEDERLGPWDVYVLKAKPRRGYKPPNTRAKVLTGMEGTLWIEKNTFQWVKVEAQVIRPVSIEGFLARVEKGTRFELTQMPVRENLWLPQHFSMSARARILFLFTKRDEEDESYYGYHPAAHTEPDSAP